jgi:hypothetical protein
MKKLTKLVILATVFLAVCVPFVSAWNVDSYTIAPSGSLAQNTPVKVSFTVEFPANTSEATFPSGSDLVMTTDLVNPTWSYTITTSDGGSAVTPGFYNQTLDLSGIILSYQGHGSEVMSVTLTGKTPVVNTTSSKTMLNAYEVDKTGMVVTGSQVTKTAVISDSLQAPAATTTTTSTTTNSKMNQPNGILDQIIGMFKSLFGIQS